MLVFRVICAPDRCPSARDHPVFANRIIPGQQGTYRRLPVPCRPLLADSGLSVAPANVKLASRRAVRALLRVAEEDEVLDAAIGIEALLLADSDRDAMTHRMAQRAAVVLSVDGVDPSVVYRLVKKFYEQRPKIVHGRSWKTMNVVLEGKTYPVHEVGVVLLRALLRNHFRAEVPWTPQSLDERLLSALGSNNGSDS